MATWHQPSSAHLRDSLTKVCEELEAETKENPPFENVTGLSSEELTSHAVEAVAMFAANETADFTKPITLIQLYSLGFVVGSRYGERRTRDTSDERNNDDRQA